MMGPVPGSERPEEWISGHSSRVFDIEIPLTPMGVLAPVSAQAGPSAQPPIDVSGNFTVHVSAELPSNIFPNPSKVIYEVSELYDKSF